MPLPPPSVFKYDALRGYVNGQFGLILSRYGWPNDPYGWAWTPVEEGWIILETQDQYVGLVNEKTGEHRRFVWTCYADTDKVTLLPHDTIRDQSS